ncbi:MAG: selenium cofactor biosynthesis protein YqeC [Halobacteriales archaeon]
MDVLEALAPGGGLVAVVGAGGKKSTLYALADRIDRAIVTATVRIPIFDSEVATVEVTPEPVAALRAAGVDDWPLGLVPERERSDRYLGYDPAVVDDVAAAGVADAVLVKADGARMREFKAPDEREPEVPARSDVVVPVASVHAVGRPLDEETIHRPARVADVTGRAPGEEIRPRDVAAVLTSPEGGLKDVPGSATVRPVLNKVDDGELEASARAVAEQVVEHPDVERVALARMLADEPLVDVVS